MIQRRVPLLFLLLLLAVLATGCRRSTTGHQPWKIGGGVDVVDPGEPVLDPVAGFAGSTVCGDCHREIFDQWAETYHNLSTRVTDRPGATGEAVVADTDGNGVDDFRDGLDLATDADFAAYGANAPKLSYVDGDDLPYKVTIGAVTYDVWRTMGGNGPWRQRYVTQVGISLHTLPVQYNEQAANWVPYDPETWYDGANLPRFADARTVKDEIARGTSNEIRCMGCHSNAYTVELDASGQYASGYVELTIGCENCHGPAADHVASGGDAALVLNPADLLDGTVNGVLAADLTCGKCHIRGRGNEVDMGGDLTLFPWDGSAIFPPGSTNLADFYTPTADPADYWRYKDNPMGFVPTPDDPTDDTFVTAREAEMTYLDLVSGPHGPDKTFDPVCFSCHDPHSRAQRHQIRDRITNRGDLYTGVNQDNNKLCLACHQSGDFAGLTPADVEAITNTSAPAVVVTAVSDHMKNRAAMPINTANYDPFGTGLGRCTGCHMVETSLSAEYRKDPAGNNVGDIHGHTFRTIVPIVSKLTNPPITNSCNICHPLTPTDLAAIVIEEWVDDPDGDGTFHADTPANFQTGVANSGRNGGVACVACHTTDGFVRVQVNGTDIHDLTDPADADTRTAIVLDSVRRDKGITCEACHGKDSSGNFAAGPNPLRFPKAELCGRCHNNQTTLYEDYVGDGEIVRHPQQQMFSGVDGGEVPGQTYSNSVHTTLAADGCVTCHFNSAGDGPKHDFMPTIASCLACHPGLTTFDRTARADYDGDGTVEGIQTELDGCLEILRAAILATPTSTGATITFDDPYFLIDGTNSNTAALDATADAAIMRAMFNHNWVNFDASRGIHNTAYALQLIQNSYEETTGNAWPGVKR